MDIESIATELEDLGLERYGYRRLYSGITGEYIDTEIFIGPTYYQRLQKFTSDTTYSISAGPSDAITYRNMVGTVRVKTLASQCTIGDTFKFRGYLDLHCALI